MSCDVCGGRVPAEQHALEKQIAAAVDARFRNLGPVFVNGAPPAPGQSSATAFGLVKTEFSELAPVAVQANFFPQALTTADTAAIGTALTNVGLQLVLPQGGKWLGKALLRPKSSVGAANGLVIAFTPDTPGNVSRRYIRGRSSFGAVNEKQISTGNTLPAFGNADTSGGTFLPYVELDFVFDLTAGVTLNVQVSSATAGETWIIGALSTAWALRVA